MKNLRTALLAAGAVLTAALASGPASSMPASGLKVAADQLSRETQNVAWVCPRYHRCYWVGGPRFFRGDRDRDRDDFRFRFRRDRDRDFDRR
jgi:hypothetical protein